MQLKSKFEETLHMHSGIIYRPRTVRCLLGLEPGHTVTRRTEPLLSQGRMASGLSCIFIDLSFYR